MHLTGLLGMLALLGLAWAMSSHRRSVRLRTVVWGIGLQVLFAIIILRQDWLSFAGMIVFGLLLVVYLLQADHARLGWGWAATALFAAAGIALGAVAVFAVPGIVPWALAGVVVLLLVNGGLRFVQPVE